LRHGKLSGRKGKLASSGAATADSSRRMGSGAAVGYTVVDCSPIQLYAVHKGFHYWFAQELYLHTIQSGPNLVIVFRGDLHGNNGSKKINKGLEFLDFFERSFLFSTPFFCIQPDGLLPRLVVKDTVFE
jgi:hypothetical protein